MIERMNRSKLRFLRSQARKGLSLSEEVAHNFVSVGCDFRVSVPVCGTNSLISGTDNSAVINNVRAFLLRNYNSETVFPAEQSMISDTEYFEKSLRHSIDFCILETMNHTH